MSLDYNPPPTLIMREYSQDDLMKEMASRENSLTRRGSCIDFYDPLPLPPSPRYAIGFGDGFLKNYFNQL